MGERLTFSGHETFYCRYLWLKKGYEFIKNDGNFRDEYATVKLGVGKNMVASIRYWMQAFGLIDKKGELTSFAKMILDDKGYDPYLERLGSIWLLHYNLIITNYASIYPIFFKSFRRQYNEFNVQQLFLFIEEECRDKNIKYSENTLRNDIDILLKNYKKSASKKNLEEEYTSLLSELNLVNEITLNDTYKIGNYSIEQLDFNILIFAILNEYKNEVSISVNDIMNNPIHDPSLDYSYASL